ncbi:sugar (pentulose or hexulose) kinase [Elusimicrobium simillimum]|uniref:FGGY family carbohydrate kinase n=1 Tax=Elusimicrobium simillimum TaxID=3143438 RepID=UPI003C6EB511
MPKPALLIDFGASRIKAALLLNGVVTRVNSYPSVTPKVNAGKRFETSLEKVKNTFLAIVKEYYYAVTTFDSVYICSEMHGFALLDDNNKPLSEYISWKDERSLEDNSFEVLKAELGNSFFEKTGMQPRPCYPLFNINAMVKRGEIKKAKVVSLPEWLCACGGSSLNIAHDTMSAGLGFYNIYTKSFDADLINAAGNAELSFNKVSHDIVPGGYIELNGKQIAIYTGVGDHQCALLGAGVDDTSISVNLGTGSQVSMLGLDNKAVQKRPFFNDELLSVITHIPSGRALNAYKEAFDAARPGEDFWAGITAVTLEDIKNADTDINLAVFESAWGYTGPVQITVPQGSLKNWFASILKSYVTQYKTAIDRMQPGKQFNKIILSGGVSAKLPVVAEYLQMITNYAVRQANCKYDETFCGLQRLALGNNPK